MITCKKVGTVKVPHVDVGSIIKMIQCGNGRVYWVLESSYISYYVTPEGKRFLNAPKCPVDMLSVYTAAFLRTGADAALWICDVDSTRDYFVTASDIDLDSIARIAKQLDLYRRIMYVVIKLNPNTPIDVFCRQCAHGETSTHFEMCLICRRLYGTEVSPILIGYLKWYLREIMSKRHGRVWEQLADTLDKTTLTKEEFNEIIDGILAVASGEEDVNKLPKRLIDIIAGVWEWV